MSSIRQLMSSRANGALSRGPKTPEGKRKSSLNAVRHGLLSKIVVAQNESRHGFDLVFGDHFNTFEPTNGVELGFTETMAASAWRLRRLWALENKMMNDAIEAAGSADELTSSPPRSRNSSNPRAIPSSTATPPASTAPISALSATCSFCAKKCHYQTNPVNNFFMSPLLHHSTRLSSPHRRILASGARKFRHKSDAILVSTQPILSFFGINPASACRQTSRLSAAIRVVPRSPAPTCIPDAHPDILRSYRRKSTSAQEVTPLALDGNLTRILVVDDEINQRSALAGLIIRWGYEVITAQNGVDALTKLKNFDADVVITDLNMPEIDGKGLLEELHKSPSAPAGYRAHGGSAISRPPSKPSMTWARSGTWKSRCRPRRSR